MKNFWLSLSHPSSDRKERSMDESFSSFEYSFRPRTELEMPRFRPTVQRPLPKPDGSTPVTTFDFLRIGRHSTNFPSWKVDRKQIVDSKRWRRPCRGSARTTLEEEDVGDIACGSWWRTKCRNLSLPIVRTARWRKGSNTFSRTRPGSVERVYEPTRGTLGHEFLPKEQLVRRHVSSSRCSPLPTRTTGLWIRNRSGFLNEQCVPGLIQTFNWFVYTSKCFLISVWIDSYLDWIMPGSKINDFRNRWNINLCMDCILNRFLHLKYCVEFLWRSMFGLDLLITYRIILWF